MLCYNSTRRALCDSRAAREVIEKTKGAIYSIGEFTRTDTGNALVV